MSKLTQLHEAIVEKIKVEMPILQEVKAYDPTNQQEITSPAVLIEVTEMHLGKKLAGKGLPVNIEFVAHCILSVKTQDVELEIRNFAVEVMKIVDSQRWGLDFTELPSDLAAFQGMFDPIEKGFESWVVTWSQIAYIGFSIFDHEPDWLPQKVWLGQIPNVGLAHQDDYDLIYDGAVDE